MPEAHSLVPVPISAIRLHDPFWSPKIKIWREVTFHDTLNKFEEEGAFDNFDRIAQGLTGEHKGRPWYDGLIYETIRAGADFLASRKDRRIEGRLDALIERIAKAASKDKDGYLNTFTQLMRPEQRWGLNGGDAIWQHDLYNAGAMVEAGVHYQQATGKIKLLAIATRFANHICDVMGPAPKLNIVPEHAMPEEAFVELYRLYRDCPELKALVGFEVDEIRFLQMVEFWVEVRGHYEGRKSFGSYSQDHLPILDQSTIEGHAVRATLLFSGMVAAAIENQRPDYHEAVHRLWNDMVFRKMHITGGVGAYAAEEKFGADYELPNDAYLETCAAVSAAFFHRNMNLAFGEGRSIDELERALYNGILAGVSLSGDHYFYVNPLEAGASHVRWSWHSCPCCPPMFLKAVAALPGYLYAQDQDTVYVNLFAGSEARVSLSDVNIQLKQSTRYPWNGHIKLTVDLEKDATFGVAIRIPQGSEGWQLKVNGEVVPFTMERNYAVIRRTWQLGDRIDLRLPLKAQLIQSNPKAVSNRGLNAIQYGPVVYCLESVDNGGHVRDLGLSPFTRLSARYVKDLLGGVVKVSATGLSVREENWGDTLYRPRKSGSLHLPVRVTAIPYYANANRLAGDMRVWIPETADLTEPRPLPTIASMAVASASHRFERDPLSALSDRLEPRSSCDATIARFTWWPHQGTTEWVQYEFDEPTEIEGVEVYWWDERKTGANCRVPSSWKLYYRSGSDWKPIEGATAYGLEIDTYNRTTFNPVLAHSLRLEVQMQTEHSAGILEWQVLGSARST